MNPRPGTGERDLVPRFRFFRRPSVCAGLSLPQVFLAKA